MAERTPESIVGTVLGDFVRGRLSDDRGAEVARAIRLHRQVDTFTDAHARTLASRNRFRPPKRRYAAVIVDMCYDHFLCRHWGRYSDHDLDAFVTYTYASLLSHAAWMPSHVVTFVEHMAREDWLRGYGRLAAVESALERIARRARRPEGLASAGAEIAANYDALETDFLAFFPELIAFVSQRQ